MSLSQADIWTQKMWDVNMSGIIGLWHWGGIALVGVCSFCKQGGCWVQCMHAAEADAGVYPIPPCVCT